MEDPVHVYATLRQQALSKAFLKDLAEVHAHLPSNRIPIPFPCRLISASGEA
jgi:hypothetical protein